MSKISFNPFIILFVILGMSFSPQLVFIPPNSPMQMVAGEDISSEKNKIGDKILMQLSSPVFSGNDIALPEGMVFEAEISDLRKAGESEKEAYIDITIKNILCPNGNRIPMRARLNHDKLSLVSNKNSFYNEISPDSKGGPFVIKRGTTIPFISSQTLRFEYNYKFHKTVRTDKSNIKAGLSTEEDDEEEGFIPFYDPSHSRLRRNSFEDPARVYTREKNKNPYY